MPSPFDKNEKNCSYGKGESSSDCMQGEGESTEALHLSSSLISGGIQKLKMCNDWVSNRDNRERTCGGI